MYRAYTLKSISGLVWPSMAATQAGASPAAPVDITPPERRQLVRAGPRPAGDSEVGPPPARARRQKGGHLLRVERIDLRPGLPQRSDGLGRVVAEVPAAHRRPHNHLEDEQRQVGAAGPHPGRAPPPDQPAGPCA